MSLIDESPLALRIDGSRAAGRIARADPHSGLIRKRGGATEPLRKQPERCAANMLALMVFLALPALYAEAAGAADEAVVNGATSCREWSAMRVSGNAAAELWLSGFLLNLSARDDGVTLDDAALASLADWMDRFCRRESTSTIGKAAVTLYEELKSQRSPRRKSVLWFGS